MIAKITEYGEALKNKDISKKEIEELALSFANDVVENGDDIVAIEAQRRKLAAFFDKIPSNKAYKEYLLNEVDRVRGGITESGVNFSTRDVGVKYDYSDDPIWSSLNKQIKEREEYLRSLPSSGADEVDEETGEILFIARRPIKKATYSVVAEIL